MDLNDQRLLLSIFVSDYHMYRNDKFFKIVQYEGTSSFIWKKLLEY